jgi:hypothetical protein
MVCSIFEINCWPSFDNILNENLMVKPTINPSNISFSISILKAIRRHENLAYPIAFGRRVIRHQQGLPFCDGFEQQKESILALV